MKRIILSAVAAIGVLVIIYLTGCFINWESNPGKWPAGDRALAGSFGLLISVTVSGITYSFSGPQK
jgi:hypothetical protein